MITKTIFEAKSNLSELVRTAQKGEEVIITCGRNRVPVARLEAIHPAGKKPRCNGKPGIRADRRFLGAAS